MTKIVHDEMGPRLVDDTPRAPHLTGEERVVRVAGRSQSHYDVTIQRDVAVRCSCSGWRYRKECRHTREWNDEHS